VRVLQHHWDGLKHVLKADVVLADGVWGKVSVLVELHHGWRQAVGFQGQEPLRGLERVWNIPQDVHIEAKHTYVNKLLILIVNC
jgi:hypothetical protein